jgi:hypothetical protein
MHHTRCFSLLDPLSLHVVSHLTILWALMQVVAQYCHSTITLAKAAFSGWFDMRSTPLVTQLVSSFRADALQA